MSFINKSVNYSQTVLLKENLSKKLKSYNDFILSQIDEENAFSNLDYHMVPNNFVKYYLYVTFKTNLENCKENHNILYFFPDKKTSEHHSENKTIKHTISDFYLEIDNRFDKEYIFEGYMYKSPKSRHFLISDILLQNDNVVSIDYAMRHALINEIIFETKGLVGLNNHLTIGIHPMFQTESINMIKIFINNFIFSETIIAMEKIDGVKKVTALLESSKEENKVTEKEIEYGGYADVYNVYDLKTGNKEGILYVKGVKESRQLNELFKNKTSKCERERIRCNYNTTFNKWQPSML